MFVWDDYWLGYGGDRPTTPFGYYSSEHGALVMNIATGGGTLVHEIVHPFMEANFPECPAWFNEGLASLYEKSAERNGRIVGLTNWRLRVRGLKQVIRTNDARMFEALCATTTSEFYQDGKGDNYAQARYLCYYLQEKGRLRKFFHEFAKNVDNDPTGYKTLKRVLGHPGMSAFQRVWERYVLALRFSAD